VGAGVENGGEGLIRNRFYCGVLRTGAWLAGLFTPGVAFAQNCALCYTQAASSGSRMIAALRSGILILAVPPMLICLGITWMAYKKRNQFNEDTSEDPTEAPRNEP
jgi:hypothetical protein